MMFRSSIIFFFLGYLCSLLRESLVGTSLHRHMEQDKLSGLSLNSKLAHIIPECSVCVLSYYDFWVNYSTYLQVLLLLDNIQTKSHV